MNVVDAKIYSSIVTSWIIAGKAILYATQSFNYEI